MRISYKFPVVTFYGDDPEDSELITYDGSVTMTNIRHEPYEATVQALSSSYHIIFGRHQNGGFLCIPEHHVGCEPASLSDVFWNHESLLHNGEQLNYEEATAIAYALKEISSYIK